MKTSKSTAKALTLLFQTGVLGLSSALAATPAKAESTQSKLPSDNAAVSDRLLAIRSAVSHATPKLIEDQASGAKLMLAEWLNFGGGLGWRNGGWGNGGWHNWGNGGWGNGGWHNWGNGGWHNWGNGWHNFWHNW